MQLCSRVFVICFSFDLTINSFHYNFHDQLHFTHKGWDFRDDCYEFLLSLSLCLWFLATANLFIYFLNLKVSHEKTTFKAKNLILGSWDLGILGSSNFKSFRWHPLWATLLLKNPGRCPWALISLKYFISLVLLLV